MLGNWVRRARVLQCREVQRCQISSEQDNIGDDSSKEVCRKREMELYSSNVIVGTRDEEQGGYHFRSLTILGDSPLYFLSNVLITRVRHDQLSVTEERTT